MFARSDLILLLVSVAFNDAANILAFFPIPSISHQAVFRCLTQRLAQRGHKVTVITPDPAFVGAETPRNLVEVDVHNISYQKWRELYEASSKSDHDLITQMKLSFRRIAEIVGMLLDLSEVRQIIKDETFDLLLIEASARPALLLAHAVKAPVILVSSFGTVNFNVETVGSAWHPLLYPDIFSQRLYNLTNGEKFTELVNFFRTSRAMKEIEDRENEIGKSLYGENVSTISELKNKVEMMFLNSYTIWADNRPVPPSVIYVGGMCQKPVNELPQELKVFLDSSRYGVIYISFGTNIHPSLLPPERIQMMTKVFSELRYEVLWKWDLDELPGQPMNIRIEKWVPQSDVLLHPQVKLFITQGGIQSTYEAILSKVPMIGIPMMGDQWYNAEKYVHHGIGIKLNLFTMTKSEFKTAITTIVGNKTYRNNVIKLKAVMRDQPINQLDLAMWWTEHVLRHGGARHLRSPAANMSWTQYIELELILTVMAFSLGFVLVLLFGIYQIWKLFSTDYIEVKVKDK